MSITTETRPWQDPSWPLRQAWREAAQRVREYRAAAAARQELYDRQFESNPTAYYSSRDLFGQEGLFSGHSRIAGVESTRLLPWITGQDGALYLTVTDVDAWIDDSVADFSARMFSYANQLDDDRGLLEEARSYIAYCAQRGIEVDAVEVPLDADDLLRVLATVPL